MPLLNHRTRAHVIEKRSPANPCRRSARGLKWLSVRSITPPPPAADAEKPPMIDVRNLTKYYGEYPAIRDVSFEVPAGQIVGFLGPNGAGKTTTMRILTGYLAATSGEAKI